MSAMDAALDLFRRLPPQKLEENLQLLTEIRPDLADDVLGAVDAPLKVLNDSKAAREYLACEFNRDGDSYRSPWSGEYDPPLADGTQPSDKLRQLEIAANDAFDVYREQYFEGGVSSVYLWDLEDGSFAGVVLLKKTLPAPSQGATTVRGGSWDSIHVFEAAERSRTRNAHYKLTSTVMLHMVRKDNGLGELELGGSMTRQSDQDAPLDSTLPNAHLANIGRMVEDMESKLRGLIQEVYGSKTKDVVNDLRSLAGTAEGKRRAALRGDLVAKLRQNAPAAAA